MSNFTIMYGTSIRSSADKLRKTDTEQVFRSLRDPKPEMAARIRQLRIVYGIDAKQYAELKRQLPYFVCGIFSPPYRRKEHFAYTETFLVDIDHIAAKGLSLTEIRQRIQGDPRVLLCFTSPSEDGLKVMFRLGERCYDSGVYTLFYKAFVRAFSQTYGLEQVVDDKTCDVSRACFISVDPEAYFNAECEPVDLSSFVDLSDPYSMSQLRFSLDKEVSTPAEDENAGSESPAPTISDPDKEVLDRIRDRLSTRKKKDPAPEKLPVEVPVILNEIIGDVKSDLEEAGLVVSEVSNIQYGKKIKVRLGLKQAEVNLFYGKRGFSVVVSPKRGTDSELNDLTADLVRTYIETH